LGDVASEEPIEKSVDSCHQTLGWRYASDPERESAPVVLDESMIDEEHLFDMEVVIEG